MSIKFDLEQILSGGTPQTNFTTQLLHLIFKADRSNKRKLSQGFPNAVKAVELYQDTGKIQDFKSD